MAVYVDQSDKPYGRMMMCHMMADSTEELLAMAVEIGVSRRWLQSPGTRLEHFDICKAKRTLAIAAGAKELTNRDMAKMTLARRTTT